MTVRRLRSLLDDLAADRAPVGDRGRLSRRLVAPGASVTLECDDREALRVADRTLYSYRPTQPGRSRWRVTVRTTGPLHAAPYVFAGAPSVEVGPRLRARVLDSEDGATFWVDHHATLIHTNPRDRTVQAYCARPAAPRYWALRLTRQAMTAQLRADGAVYAHAAACTIDGTGVLITGHKGSGKTTTLLSCLRLLGADLVANDRVLLRREARGLLGHPWPTHLRLGVGTLRTFPDLAHLHGATDPQSSRTAKFSVEPPEFPRLLVGGVVAEHVRPRLMLWPRLALDDAGTGPPERVSPDEVRRTLLDTRLFMTDPDGGAGAHVNDWLTERLPADTPRPPSPPLREVVDVLAATVDCHRVAVTGDPRALAAQISTLLPPRLPGTPR